MSFIFTSFLVNCKTKITCKLWLHVLHYLKISSNHIIDFLILSVFFSLASACSHIAAVLFKLEGYFRMDIHKVASTSNVVNERDLVNKLQQLPWGKLLSADQSRPTHVQKILMMATVLKITLEWISQVKDWQMSKNKNSMILSYWYQRVPYSII